MQVLYFCTRPAVGLFLVTTLSSCAVTSEPYRGRLIRTESKPVTMTSQGLRLGGDFQLIRVSQCEITERPVYEQVARRYYCKVEGDTSGCTVPCTGSISAAQCTGNSSMERWMAFMDHIEKNKLPYRLANVREEEIKTGRVIEGEWITRQTSCPTASTQPLEGKPASITLRDIGSGHDLWRWEGTTGKQGEVDLSTKVRGHLLDVLWEMTRSDMTRGEVILTSEHLRSVMPLAQVTALLRLVGPL